MTADPDQYPPGGGPPAWIKEAIHDIGDLEALSILHPNSGLREALNGHGHGGVAQWAAQHDD